MTKEEQRREHVAAMTHIADSIERFVDDYLGSANLPYHTAEQKAELIEKCRESIDHNVEVLGSYMMMFFPDNRDGNIMGVLTVLQYARDCMIRCASMNVDDPNGSST